MSRPEWQKGVAALLAVAMLSACSTGGAHDQQEQGPEAEPAADSIVQVEPTWTREVTESGGPLSWAAHGERAYLAVWPGPDGGPEAELIAVDLATGEDLWSVPHQGAVGDLIADEGGGVIVVQTAAAASTLTAYDEQGQQRWVSTVEAIPDEVSSGLLLDPVAAFDLDNDLVLIGSRSTPGIIGLDLIDGDLRWHLQHESDADTPLYAGTQLSRFGDAVVAIDDFNAPSIAVLNLDANGQEPAVRWHRDPGTGFGDGIIGDAHGIVAVTARYVRTWDLSDGAMTGHQVMDWQREEPGAGGLEGRAFAGVYLFEDTIVIERDRRWVLDRAHTTVRTSYDLDSAGAAPLTRPGGAPVGAYGPDDQSDPIAIGPDGAIARIDARGQVHALQSDAVDADSTYVPRLLVGDSSVAVAVKRSDGHVWNLWATDRAQVMAAE